MNVLGTLFHRITKKTLLKGRVSLFYAFPLFFLILSKTTTREWIAKIYLHFPAFLLFPHDDRKSLFLSIKVEHFAVSSLFFIKSIQD
jgi:hypothetical protein